MVATALGLLWMYSYEPAKLSYRGGGEFLQMLGVGFVLPFFGYYAQAGEVTGFPWAILAAILPTQLACAMATSLPDEPSDRLSGKHTMTVLLGDKKTKGLIFILNLTSIVLFPFAGWLSIGNPVVYKILLLPFLAALVQLFFMNSRPGSIRLTLFTFLSVLVTLSLMGGMAIALLC
jgi:1,4-dihydroxy-2-naphthoate octaprenyltransferase